MPMAAALTAVKAIIDAGVKLKGDLVLLFIPGEGAQVHSLPMVVRDHPEVMRADWYLDTEGGPNIAKVAGGWIWVKISVEGITGHTAGRRPDGGEGRPVNAIFRLAKILTAIEDPADWMTFQKHTLITNTLYGGKPVVEVGKIEGGYKVNQVPDRASAQVDIRLLPGQTPDGVMGELRAVFAKLAKTDPELKASAEIMTQQWVPMKYWETLNDNDPLVKAIREVAPPILGSVPGWSGSIGGGRPDIWATGAKWISFGGGGGGGNAHSPNEFASVKGGVTRATLYARVILRVLGS
jgi:acetylornithine deacetylase/succinyl-diaminopimelate desuccinylase-like protein